MPPPHERQLLSAPVQQSNPLRSISIAAAAIVIVAAIGFPLAKYRLGQQQFLTTAGAAPPNESTRPAVIERTAAAPPARAVESSAKEVTAAAAPAVKESGPAPRPAPRPAPVQPRTTRPSQQTRQPVASASANTTVPAPVAEASAPAAPVAAAPEPPRPEPSAVPVSPFFEVNQVNESPKVASRVAPRVPDELRDRATNDVVIVRILVSQTGHPHFANLLRGSKAGRAIDEAVIEAVKQWTFVPARKRGEAVSCWFNLGVPVSPSGY